MSYRSVLCHARLPGGNEVMHKIYLSDLRVRAEITKLCPEYEQVFKAADAFMAAIKSPAQEHLARIKAIFFAWPSDEYIDSLCDVAFRKALAGARGLERRYLPREEYSALRWQVYDETRGTM